MNAKLNDNLIFTDSDNKEKAVLGTLEGPCADIIHGTRNGRRYSESLWEKTFNSPIFKEMIKNGGIPGELDHPVDREETDSSRIAVILREKPKKKDGLLWAKFDILNTPLGKIAYTLAKAGFKLGISSRGSGEVIQGYDGTEEVDESTYDFKAFDLVLLPAVESARLNLVTESLNSNKFDYRKQLLEYIENSSNEDKELMLETLSNMNIEIDSNKEEDNTEASSYIEVVQCINDGIKENIDKEDLQNYLNDIIIYCKSVAKDYDIIVESIDVEDSKNLPVDNHEGEMEELQKTLKENNELSNTITKLQEKLSVSYAKEAELKEDLNRYFRSIKKLTVESKKVNPLKIKINSLMEELEKVKQNENSVYKNLKKSKSSLKEQLYVNKNLTEELTSKEDIIRQLKTDLFSLSTQYKDIENKLNENFNKLQKDSELKETKYKDKLEKSIKLVEKYKSITNKAVDKYIESQAIIIGVTKNEIKNRLSENYSFNEIDSICEDLKEYKLNLNKLPFRTDGILNENVKMKITSSKNESILPANRFDADDVDEQLKSLAGL